MVGGSRQSTGTTRWWWIRHAPVTAPAGMILPRDVPAELDAGVEKALHGLRQNLPDPALYLASSLPRATISIAKLSHVPAQRLAAFDEQSFGSWTGSTHQFLWDSGDPIYRAFWADPAGTPPPEGESFAAQCARVGRAIEELGAMHQGMDLVVMAHAGTVRAALALALGLPPAQVLRFVIDHLSLTRIVRLDGAWRVDQVNSRG
jgi:alpha-ribazole phosphatase